MASKYDFFWRSRLKDISMLLDKAYHSQAGHVIDVSGIKNLGDRYNWYGVVNVCKDTISRGEMAHAKSLGNIIKENELLKRYGDCSFTLTITADCKLTAIKASKGRVIQSPPTVVNHRSEQPIMNKQRIDGLTEILSDVPWESWIKIVEEEPEWHNMEHFISKYGFGPFTVLMIVLGLNDFQLKGKAEVAYWVPIKNIFEDIPVINEPKDIFYALVPFFKKERYDELKINRMRKFLKSDLVNVLWTATPDHAVKIFPYVWKELAKTMGQELSAKTISFAMKCFGVALLIAGKSDFDFTHIPIPVDYRVLVFTEKAGITDSKDADSVRDTWQIVLEGIQKKNKQVTMLHLDSLIWQIGVLNNEGLKNYFNKMGASEIGFRLITYLKGEPVRSKSVEDSISKPIRISKFSDGKIVCFIPCCKSKYASGNIIEPIKSLSEGELPQTWKNLKSGRESMQYCIDKSSSKTTAFDLYTGFFYKPLIKNVIFDALLKQNLTVIILSAGYGMVNALEPINDYDAMLSGEVARAWRDIGLAEVIADYLISHNPSKVYGFFAGNEFWSDTSSNYRYFFSEGVKSAIKHGLKINAGCLYRIDGRGASSILTALGRAFNEFVNIKFDQNYLDRLQGEGINIDNIKIGYQKIAVT